MVSATEAAKIFKVLSVETRVRMMLLLREKSLCVNALAYFLGISPAAVSQHLRTMRETGIVIPEKRGYFVHYRIDEARLRHWDAVAHGILGTNGNGKDTEEGKTP
jgi:DNA-binding transcriptional ArsR family regulator